MNKTYNIFWIFCRLGLRDIGWFIDQLELKDPTRKITKETMQHHVRRLMDMKKKARDEYERSRRGKLQQSHGANSTIEEPNDTDVWTLFEPKRKTSDDTYAADGLSRTSSSVADDEPFRLGVFDDTDDETLENEPVTNPEKFVADHSEAPSNNRKALHPRPKSDGESNETDETDEKAMVYENGLGLIYLTSSKHQMKIGSSVDLSKSLGDILPDMTNHKHRYSTFVKILFVYL